MHCFRGVSFSCPSISASVLLIQRIIIIQFRFKGPTTTVSHFNVITIRYRTTNPRTVSASDSNRLFQPVNFSMQQNCTRLLRLHSKCILYVNSYFSCHACNYSASHRTASSSGGRRSYQPSTPLLAFVRRRRRRRIISPTKQFLPSSILLRLSDSFSLALAGRIMMSPTPPPAIKLSSLDFSLFSLSQDEAWWLSYRCAR